MRNHEELRHVIDDFFSSVLLRKPQNLKSYASDYFSELLKPQKGIIICGLHGVGKSTLIKKLLNEFPKAFECAIEHTTMTSGMKDIDGEKYYYVSDEKMNEMIEEGKLLRIEERNGEKYGITKQVFNTITKNGKICIINTDLKGSLEYLRCGKFDEKPYFIYIKPPSTDELHKRLIEKKESDEIIHKTMTSVEKELESLEDGIFDFILLNDNIESAYHDLKIQLYKWYKHLLAIRKTYNLPL